MSKFTLSKLSLSLGLLSSISAMALECPPSNLDNQTNQVLANCHLDHSETTLEPWEVRYLLMAIKNNSDLTIDNSDIQYKNFSSSSDGMADIVDSTLNVIKSKLRSVTPPKGYLFNAQNATISVKDSTLLGGAEVSIVKADNANVTIDRSHLTVTNAWLSEGSVFNISRHSSSTINLNDSTVDTSTFLSTYTDFNREPDDVTSTVNVNKSRITSDRLMYESSIYNQGKIIFNVNDSDISGRLITKQTDIPVDMNLSNSKWLLPYGIPTWGNAVSNLTLDKSEITLSMEDSEFQTFTIFENLSGNGHFELNTDLANQQSDKIVVMGEDRGNFTLGIQDSGKEPSTANGKVTLVETQLGQAEFRLKDKDYVDAGAYRYRLNKEGSNWVLSNRNGETVPTLEPTPITGTTDNTASPTTETADNIASPTTGTTDNIASPTTGTADNIPSPTTGNMGNTPASTNDAVSATPTALPMAMLSEKSNALISLRQAQSLLTAQNTQGIHQRLGELKENKSGNVWIKNVNSHTKAKSQKLASDSQSSGFDMDSYGIQIGTDHALNNQFSLGGFIGSNRATVDFNGEYGKGKLRSQAIGSYITFTDESGWYLDNIGMYEYLTSQSNTEKRNYHTFGLSSEIGKRIDLAHNWRLTPHAQLSYHTISGKADEKRLTLLTTQVGGRLAKTFTLNSGWRLQPYVELNAMGKKSNQAKVQVNQYSFEVPENKGRLQTSIGFTAGNAHHQFGLESSMVYGKQLKQPFSLLVNYRYQW